jgi:hypothetical protein
MAELGEAFNILKFQKKSFQNIDYFFTQRALVEEQEYIDKHMMRKINKVKVIHNFLAINIPTIITNNNGQTENALGFDIEIFGDEGYHYKGTISSFQGTIPNFMIPIKEDKKLFVNINYKSTDTQNNTIVKTYVNFIEVPKRFQSDNKKIDVDDTNQDSEQVL